MVEDRCGPSDSGASRRRQRRRNVQWRWSKGGNGLNTVGLESHLKALVSGQPADYVEIRVEETRLTEILFRGPVLDNLGESLDYGGNVRALVDGGWGFVSFNSLEGLEAKVELAIRQARLVGARRKTASELVHGPVVRDKVTLNVGEDPREVPLAKKKEIIEGYNRLVLDYGRGVTSSFVRYGEAFRRHHFANSDGTFVEQEKLDLRGMVTAIATRNGETHQITRGFGSTRSFDVARGQEKAAEEACAHAVALLGSPVVTAGEYTVVLDQRMAGLFVHEAFGHLSEGDFVYENPNLRKVMTLGREFGGRRLNIFDAGTIPGARGWAKYDDEGTPTEKTYLIREGKLVGRLHSRETAAKMGERPTGSARALDYRFPPIPRMRATFIENGEAPFEELLKGIRLGVYVRGSEGGETAMEMFTFTAEDGVMIRDGSLAEIVHGVTLTGNVFATLGNIDMIGNDFEIYPGSCGKGGQSPLPVGMGGPHVRIRNVVVGGRAR